MNNDTPSDPKNQLSLFPLNDGSFDPLPVEFKIADGAIRGVSIHGVAYISIIDAYKAAGSSNGKQQWARDYAEMREQGYGTNLLPYQFMRPDGQRARETPVVTEEQFARIAQVAKIPAWEGWRQEMARLWVQSRKAIPVTQTKAYRAHIDGGDTPEQAKRAVEIRETQKERQKRITEKWAQRGAKTGKDYQRLNNDITQAATGKTATEWKRELEVSDTPRNHFSALKNGLIGIVQEVSGWIHENRDSRGVDELETDIFDAGNVIDKSKLEAILSDNMPRLPEPKPDQQKLIEG